jgi:Methyltransferase domain
MDLHTFASNISFKLFGPDSSLRWYHRLNHRIARVNLSLEVLNTRLPHDRREARRLLRRICGIPRMSTYAIAAIIDKAVAAMPEGAAFVNVGAWHGFTFLSGIANNPDRRCVCIDNFSQFGGPREQFLARFQTFKSENHTFHEMDYEQYFATIHNGPIGCYIYDGEHSYRNQLRGLEVAEPFFTPGCVVLVDDTNDEEPRQATYDFVARRSGQYELLLDKRTCSNQHPTFWNGIIVLRRLPTS